MHHDSLLIRIKVKCADRHESLQKIAVFEMRTSEVEESSELRVAPSARLAHENSTRNYFNGQPYDSLQRNQWVNVL